MDYFHNLSNKKILYKTDEQRDRILGKLNTIKCHNILNSNFLDHFFFYIFETEKENIIIRMYKQKYDKRMNDWNREKLTLMTSICLNFDDPEDNIYNIDNIDNNDYELRYRLMREENEEYLEAAKEGDLVEIADALGDQLYILCGTILKHGLQHKISEVFEEIQRSNMSKLDENGKPIYREDGKVLKSTLYFKPNIKEIIEK